MYFSRELWVKWSHEEVCKQVDAEWDYDPDIFTNDEIMEFLLARIEWAEELTALNAMKYLLEINGLELV